MQAFVKDKNTQARNDEARIVDIAESLKVPVPTLGNSKEHKHHRTQRLRDNMLPDQQHHRSSKSNKAAKGNDGYNGSREPITDGVEKSHVGPYSNSRASVPQQSTAQGLHYLEPHDIDEFDNIDVESDFRIEVMPDDQIELMKKRLLGHSVYPSIEKYIEGDSYPDTTSGRLTDDGIMINRADLTTRAVHDLTVPSIKRSRSAADYTTPNAEHDQASGNTQPFFWRPDDAILDNTHGFQMSLPGPAPSGKRQAVVKPAREVQQENRAVNQAKLYQHSKPTRRATQTEHVAPEDLAKGERQHMPIHVERRNPPKEVVRDDHIMYNGHLHTVSEPSHDETPDLQPSLLDHELEQLHHMTYEQLKAETFDHDPKLAPPVLPGIEANDSVAVQVDTLKSLSPEQWSDFFYSLDLKAWEESGDWFLEQFSGIITQLKDIRQERRKSAQAFEAEVEQRHAAVVKKRIMIRNTMEGMRTSGSQVLFTPGRAPG